jgi:hypothetical protein
MWMEIQNMHLNSQITDLPAEFAITKQAHNLVLDARDRTGFS